MLKVGVRLVGSSQAVIDFSRAFVNFEYPTYEEREKSRDVLVKEPYLLEMKPVVNIEGRLYSLEFVEEPKYPRIAVDPHVAVLLYYDGEETSIGEGNRGVPFVVVRMNHERDVPINTRTFRNAIKIAKRMDCSTTNQTEVRKVFETAVQVALSAKNNKMEEVGGLTHPVSRFLKQVPESLMVLLKHVERINLSGNYIEEFETLGSVSMESSILSLHENCLVSFPKLSSMKDTLMHLDLSKNKITSIPEDIMIELPNLMTLNVEDNLLESLPPSLASVETLFALNNPLSTILPDYRSSNERIREYLKMIQQQPVVPWNQIKMMLVGQEGVGKTTLLRSMKDSKFKCDANISTNGVDIEPLTLPRSTASTSFINLFSTQKEKEQGIQFKVWDFGGQSVFHSTHRLFVTSNAIYVIVYNMAKPETIERVKYWIEQVGSDYEATKPILIVGTHADQLTKQDRAQRSAQVQNLYPVSLAPKKNRIYGHFTLSLTEGEKGGLSDFRLKLVDIALNHPNIGIGQVTVPFSFDIMHQKLSTLQSTPYLSWHDYFDLAEQLQIKNTIQDITTMLHNTGMLVWHNLPKLRDVVVIDPQWLADALARVVSFMSQSAVSNARGMISWAKIRESMQLKFSSPEMHETILALLEFFEIVYRMKMNGTSAVTSSLKDDQMFFVPSLLSPYGCLVPHPAIQYWQQIEPRNTFKRKFSWNFYPAGFFPCLILRLVHLRLCPLACWLDAAVIMGRDGTECAHLTLSHTADKHVLEISVKTENVANSHEPLISELSYVASRLYRDMYISPKSVVPLYHEVFVTVRNKAGEVKLEVVSFDECIKAQIAGKAYHEIGGSLVNIDDIVPDLATCPLIPVAALTIEKQIGSGGFGLVHKAKLQQGRNAIDVAVKELILKNEMESIYEFQHEITIMSKLKHDNLVLLLGITKSPLQMVLEYVPMSDLHHVLKHHALTSQLKSLTLRWKLKVAIDIASGMKYLHSQHPPICHSDLRSPNIFLASLDERAMVVAKVADFGLSQQVFPFSNRPLHNIIETAPETWGDTPFYTEKSDVFSFAVILWHLFGSIVHYTKEVPKSDEESEEFDFLKVRGRIPPPKQQREIIRKGGRLAIHPNCPQILASLIRKCWLTSPDTRPSFSLILDSLLDFYATEFFEDRYIRQQRKLNSVQSDISHPQTDISYLQEFNQFSFAVTKWKSVEFEEKTKSISLIQVRSDIWMGTTDCVVMLDAQTRQIIQKETVPHTTALMPVHSRGITLLALDQNSVWAAVDNKIHVFSAKIRQEMTAALINQHSITCMTLIPNAMVVWVADASGFVSIWDAQTLQKCYQLQIDTVNCAQAMVVPHDYVWMAVGKDIIAIHSTTFERIELGSAHGDRIHEIVAVAQTNHVWTCARDRTLKVWKIEKVDNKNKITLVFESRLEHPVKSACVMADGVHVCTGDFVGQVYMWHMKTFRKTRIEMAPILQNHSVHCLLDTRNALWCGVELPTTPLQWHPHVEKY